jgi:4-methyl-5(b-hydroxyethyl)-thiazole monophosphate biosynthesis
MYFNILIIVIMVQYFFTANSLLFNIKKKIVKNLKYPAISMSAKPSSSSIVNVLVPIANGSEEIESVSIIDTLVRGGAKVTVASVETSSQVTCSRGVKIVADTLISECLNKNWDMIALPGGMPGAERLRDSDDLSKLLMNQNKNKKYIAAMCASPAVVLASKGILDGC